MNKIQISYQWIKLLVLAGILALGLAGCAKEGPAGAAGEPGPGVAPLAGSTELNFTITGVTIPTTGADAGKPTVNFSVTNQDGVAVAGFADGDLRFNIAKLVPGSGGAPSKWQNYINRVSVGLTHAYQERGTTSGAVFTDNKNGTFSFKFATDITNAPCPGLCTEADGVTPLDVSYQPTLTHRVAIQQGNRNLPTNNATYDFVPAGGSVTFTRDIVKTETCNQCHNQLAMHGGTRIDTKLCVTCHNPGTTRQGKIGTVSEDVTMDFKSLIHKVHRGSELPSVVAGGDFGVNGYTGSLVTFSDVVFPFSAVSLGDTRACAKCHTGSAGPFQTADGDNWKNQPSKVACSSCHDDVYFGNSPTKAYQTVSHITASGNTASADPTDAQCGQCHGTGQVADVEVKHDLPNLLKAAGQNYVFNIRTVTQTGQTESPIITFSVDDSLGTPYDLQTETTLTNSSASLSMLFGWNNVDENNAGNGKNLGQPININVKGCSGTGITWDSGTKICTVTASALTTPFTIPASMTGSGRVAIYGRAGVAIDADADPTTADTIERVRVKAVYKDYSITDGVTPTPRRQVVSIDSCAKCHDQVSLHGDSRTNEPGLCIMCHNPNATDFNRRRPYDVNGFPDPTLTADLKAEEAIDFKRLIHGVHAGEKPPGGHGIREAGLIVYGYFSAPATENPVDFGHVRFPGIIKDCTTCHLPGTYELTGKWEVPTLSGILGSTTRAAPDPTEATLTLAQQLATPDDDENISPTAAVCSACHDGIVAKSHMTLNGAQFGVTQAALDLYDPLEACAICHGPGRVADVKVMHGVQ